MPELTPEERQSVCQSVRLLSDVMAPARTRGPELEAEILRMFAAFNLYTGDEAKLKAMLMVWADELEEYPLFAIRKAIKWAVRSCDKLPTIAYIISDVKLAMGTNVASRYITLKRRFSR